MVNADWGTFILDNEQKDTEEWLNAMEYLPFLTPDPLFDKYGNYHNTVAISQATLMDPLIEKQQITDIL